MFSMVVLDPKNSMTLNSLHSDSWDGKDEFSSLVQGFTDPDGRYWPSVQDYNNAISKMKVVQESAWARIYSKPLPEPIET